MSERPYGETGALPRVLYRRRRLPSPERILRECNSAAWSELGSAKTSASLRSTGSGFAEYMAIPRRPYWRDTACRKGCRSNMRPSASRSSCINAQEKLDVRTRNTLIIGVGPIGCIHICVASARREVIIADVLQSPDLCSAFGPDHLVNAAETDLVEEVRRLTGGKGADVVITANRLQQRRCRPRGREKGRAHRFLWRASARLQQCDDRHESNPLQRADRDRHHGFRAQAPYSFAGSDFLRKDSRRKAGHAYTAH